MEFFNLSILRVSRTLKLLSCRDLEIKIKSGLGTTGFPICNSPKKSLEGLRDILLVLRALLLLKTLFHVNINGECCFLFILVFVTEIVDKIRPNQDLRLCNTIRNLTILQALSIHNIFWNIRSMFYVLAVYQTAKKLLFNTYALKSFSL